MPPKLLANLDAIDPDHVAYDLDAIRETIPQRFEMEQLTAIHHFDRENQVVVGSRQIGENEWWARGHIPGRPIFPGVLTIEAAAQLAEAERIMNNSGLYPVCQVLSGDPEIAIADYVKHAKIDMLVAGAYGHSRIRDLLIGSTTTALLRGCHVPVLCFR